MMAAVLAETSKNKRVALYALVFAIKVLPTRILLKNFKLF